MFLNLKMQKRKKLSENRHKVRSAFTVLELLVVVVILAMLASMLATTLATTRANTFTSQCLNNLRQLGSAWTMYADDNEGGLVSNRESEPAEGWVGGWLDYTVSTPDNTNIDYLINHTRYPTAAFFGPYLKTALPFKCPADRSVDPRSQLPRVRSISMNNYANSRTWETPSRFLLYTNLAQFKSPADVFIILEERPESINGCAFFTDADRRFQIIDYPALFHNGACTFSFADGHSETHRWLDPRTMPTPVNGSLFFNVNLPGDIDLDWLGQHASEPFQ